MTPPLHTVHVRVNDAATGQPTSVRIQFTDEKGNYYAPFGRLKELNPEFDFDVGGNLLLVDKQFAYIDGTCEIALPSGRIFIEVHKGPEYESFTHEVMLAPGKMAIRLEIRRWSDIRQERWYSGDTMVAIMSPHAALLEGAAEDLSIINLLVVAQRWGYPNLLAFSGQKPALEQAGTLVVVNTHNIHYSLGRVSLLNCHRVVYPLVEGLCDWTVADWCDQCHRKQGLVVWVPEMLPSEFETEDATLHQGELPGDLALGKIDALEFDEVWEVGSELVKEYYGFLNVGFRLPLVGGSSKVTNQQLLGGWRTYARLQPGEEFNYKNWIEAVRAGRTFATKGALLTLTVNGQDPGAVINLESSGQTVHVKAGVRRAFPPDRLELIINGKVVAESHAGVARPERREGREETSTRSTPFEDSGRATHETELETDIPMPAGGWIAAAYWGCEDSQGGFKLLAHTSPVYVQVPGRGPPPDLEAGQNLLRHFDEMLGWVRTKARVENEEQRARLARVFESATEEVTRRLGQRS
jgi:hypothetical protein